MECYAFYVNELFYGIADSWDNCKAIVAQKSGAKYKKFKSRKEAGVYLKKLATK